MSETRYQDYTPRESSVKTKTKDSFGKIFGRLFIGFSIGMGLIIGGFFWLKTQLAELFMSKQPVTVVLVDPLPGSSSGPWIFQLQPDQKKILWVNLAPETQTELFSGYGQYSVAAVYPLLTMEKKSPAYIRASLGAIAGRLVSRVEAWPNINQWQKKVQATLITTVEPNASQRDLAIQPIKAIIGIFWRKIWISNLAYDSRIEAISEFNTSLGWYWFAQQSRLKWQWSYQLSDLIPVAPPAATNCPVAVVNASNSQGLAKQMSATLTNTGYEVIRISAETATIEDSALWLDPNQADKCREVALSVAGSIPTVPKLRLDAEKTTRYRAPIVLVVGLDNAK